MGSTSQADCVGGICAYVKPFTPPSFHLGIRRYLCLVYLCIHVCYNPHFSSRGFFPTLLAYLIRVLERQNKMNRDYIKELDFSFNLPCLHCYSTLPRRQLMGHSSVWFADNPQFLRVNASMSFNINYTFGSADKMVYSLIFSQIKTVWKGGGRTVCIYSIFALSFDTEKRAGVYSFLKSSCQWLALTVWRKTLQPWL